MAASSDHSKYCSSNAFLVIYGIWVLYRMVYESFSARTRLEVSGRRQKNWSIFCREVFIRTPKIPNRTEFRHTEYRTEKTHTPYQPIYTCNWKGGEMGDLTVAQKILRFFGFPTWNWSWSTAVFALHIHIICNPWCSYISVLERSEFAMESGIIWRRELSHVAKKYNLATWHRHIVSVS
jgi:hypothetical protein